MNINNDENVIKQIENAVNKEHISSITQAKIEIEAMLSKTHNSESKYSKASVKTESNP